MQSQFYKTFTRPVAKVLLVAVFTYQLIYWSWVKLDTEETKAQADGKASNEPYSNDSAGDAETYTATIAGLEAKVDEYKKKALEAAETKSS
ncbi:uncharacterized protein J7T54_002011 [Emericellopsis cladophorae]|uniref:Uncharacterized protein n=1 Tax=Emericellopsis cladophorae TaxID=2686198 RepID=A0A9Q0BEE7_9HYPO|nr:uncharacterized protein J7T54_002011 [Emericellopsis cladophorae]KAI6782852.1 hypothetical protein J7T54_002011 [Emericellopsis cladophorae]